jgi:FkbM family methyltransferase
MINNFLKFLYRILPKTVIDIIGRSSVLKPVRDLLIRTGNRARIIEVQVKWHGLSFYYSGDIKSALKAKRKGIESSLLRLSIELLERRKPKDERVVIFDVGSSYGFLSTVWALNSSSVSKVYSFEASKSVYEVYKENILRNNLQHKITLENLAIFNVDGYLGIDIHDGTHASIVRNNSSHMIRCTKLDTFVKDLDSEKIDLIKIDVDGPELEILLGAELLLLRDKPILIIETNNRNEIPELLLKYEYQLFDMNMVEYEIGQKLPPNLIAI